MQRVTKSRRRGGRVYIHMYTCMDEIAMRNQICVCGKVEECYKTSFFTWKFCLLALRFFFFCNFCFWKKKKSQNFKNNCILFFFYAQPRLYCFLTNFTRSFLAFSLHFPVFAIRLHFQFDLLSLCLPWKLPTQCEERNVNVNVGYCWYPLSSSSSSSASTTICSPKHHQSSLRY